MECFAQRYCQLNPDIFTNTDTCYVLSFAIIMLNTSLHNPSVKDKPSVEQFISMNRGINNGGDLPRELLVSLFESIRTEPFKIPQDDGNDLMHTFFNPDKEGWLWKQGGRYIINQCNSFRFAISFYQISKKEKKNYSNALIHLQIQIMETTMVHFE